MIAVRGLQSEFQRQPAAGLLQRRIEPGAEPVAIEGMDLLRQRRRRTGERVLRNIEELRDLRADMDAIGGDIPVEGGIARSREGQGLALGVADDALRKHAPREGMLHDGEADQHDDQNEAANEGRRDKVIGEIARHGESCRADP